MKESENLLTHSISFQAKASWPFWRNCIHADEPDQTVFRPPVSGLEGLEAADRNDRFRVRVRHHHELRLREDRHRQKHEPLQTAAAI
jgi:hypothetical protein